MVGHYADFLGSLRGNACCLPSKEFLDDGIARAVTLLRVTRSERVKALIFGNGGSMCVADHIANDFSFCADWKSWALSSGANISSLGNDEGFEHVFSRQIESIARRGDIAIAISCSGKSPNVLAGARAARALGMALITLSAQDAGNELATLGDVNFWVDTPHMGLAQVAHLVILHAVCDIGAAEASANIR